MDHRREVPGAAAGRPLLRALQSRLVVVFAVGLWLPFAAMAAFGTLWVISFGGVGEGVETFGAAVAVAVVIPLGLWLFRRPGTRMAGRGALLASGWGVAAWALLDGGYGAPLWEAPVSAPVVGVMLAGVVMGALLGIAVMVDVGGRASGSEGRGGS